VGSKQENIRLTGLMRKDWHEHAYFSRPVGLTTGLTGLKTLYPDLFNRPCEVFTVRYKTGFPEPGSLFSGFALIN